MRGKVNVGECYRDSRVLWNEWRVERIYADLLGLPHAVIGNLQDPTVTRTIACPTLSDRRRFCPIPQGGRARARRGRAGAAAVTAPVAHPVNTVEAAA